MTKDELLGLGLTEDQTAKILEDYGRNYVSKVQFNAKNDEAKTFKAKIAELTTSLEAAEEKPKTEMAKLQTQVEKLTKQIEAAETAKKEAEEREITADIRRKTVEALTAGHCTNPTEIAKILVPSISRDDGGEFILKAEDGKVSTMKDGVAEWLKANPWAVSDTQKTGSGQGSSAKRQSAVTQAEFAKMGYRERAELFSQDPDLYQQLASKGE